MPDNEQTSPIRADVEALLKDLRSAIDDALVQINLGEKSVRDVVNPVIEKVNNEFLDLKARLFG
jgi:hypothetical protein